MSVQPRREMDYRRGEIPDHNRLMRYPECHPFYAGFRSINCLAMMMRCISLVPSPMHSSGASR